MPKAYWIARVDVTDPQGYQEYVAANAAAFSKYGARFIVRGGRFEAPEGTPRARNVVLEFKDYDTAVACYHSPEYAAAKAKRDGRAVEVLRMSWGGWGRALTLGRPDGATKLVVDPETEQVLGMGVVGAGAGELIAEGCLAIEMGAVVRDLAETIHPHPTLSETVSEVAESFFGTATHFVRPRRDRPKV